MISVGVENNKLFYIDYKSDKVELSDYKFINNKSKMILHKINNNNFVCTVSENYNEFCNHINSNYSSIMFESDNMILLYTLFIVIFSFGMKINTPINAAIIGCAEEVIYSVGYTIGKLRLNSSLTIINHEINIYGENDFLNPVMLLQDVNCSTLICDYTYTNLRDNSYNMLVIYNNDYENLEDIFCESNRILKDGGKLIFVVDGNSKFEEDVKNISGNFKEYAVSDNKKIILCDKITRKQESYLDFDLEKLTVSDIKKLIKQLDKEIDNKIKKDDTLGKIRLIDLKEYLTCFILYEDYKDFYKEKINKLKEDYDRFHNLLA